jgi:hypothetical protein
MRKTSARILRKRWHAAAATAAAVVAVAVTASMPALAAPAASAGTSFILKSPQDAQTGRCLDSNAAGDVYTSPCQAPGNSYQDWIETAYDVELPGFFGPPTSYSLEDAATGRCLDSNANGNLYTSPCQAPGNTYQDWVSAANVNSSPSGLADAATQRCLDSNANGNAYTLPCNGGNFQNWVIRTFVG